MILCITCVEDMAKMEILFVLGFVSVKIIMVNFVANPYSIRRKHGRILA